MGRYNVIVFGYDYSAKYRANVTRVTITLASKKPGVLQKMLLSNHRKTYTCKRTGVPGSDFYYN